MFHGSPKLLSKLHPSQSYNADGKEQNIANATIQDALEKTGKGHLYVAEEGRIYESPMYLRWHQRYQQSLQDAMMAEISDINAYKGNVNRDIANLEECTGISIDKLREMCKKQIIVDGRGR